MLVVKRTARPNVLMVHPRFSGNSFWNYRETCAVVGARYVATPLGLITVAALLPKEWSIRLVDRNAEALREDDLRWADMVMVGGMMSQQRDAKRVIALAHAQQKPVVMGGPDVTSSPAVYAEAEFRVLGEAEGIMDQFVAAWLAGKRQGVFIAKTFPDLGTSPLPRFDLLRFEHYMHVGVQFSRGCPFGCEFCNVIELNGRVPRIKSTEQIFRELDSLYALGYRGHVDVVDDNLIGNRRVIKAILTELGLWLRRRGHPFEFSCEASLDLASDQEMLAALRWAGFFAVFVGIETPDARTLLSTKKAHNAQQDIAASIRKIHRSGLFVNAGFIIGFDGETTSVARAMIDCIEEASIPVCMVGLLYALPNTQLSRRLLAEGRLCADFDRAAADSDADQCTSGLNFETLRPRREILRDYQTVLQRIYEPQAYFGRVRRAIRALNLPRHRMRNPLRRTCRNLWSFVGISLRMGLLERQARYHYWRALADCLIHNPRAVRTTVSFAALYLHFKPFARFMDDRLKGQIESTGAEDHQVPGLKRAAAEALPAASTERKISHLIEI